MFDGWAWRIGTAAVVAMLLATAVASVVIQSTDVTASAADPSDPIVATTNPVWTLSAPDLELEETLIELGLTEDHRLEVPEAPERAGWFTEGAAPGEAGPTVVVGHLDSAQGPAVFARLPELVPGDEVTVGGDEGEEFRYRVVATEDVPKDRFPTQAVYGSADGDTLRLITCTGPWDPSERAHRDNRIVYATAVDEAPEES